jgi:hypothetical protein
MLARYRPHEYAHFLMILSLVPIGLSLTDILILFFSGGNDVLFSWKSFMICLLGGGFIFALGMLILDHTLFTWTKKAKWRGWTVQAMGSIGVICVGGSWLIFLVFAGRAILDSVPLSSLVLYCGPIFIFGWLQFLLDVLLGKQWSQYLD